MQAKQQKNKKKAKRGAAVAVSPAAIPAEREYVSVAEASRITSLSGWTLRHWAYEGKIASCKIGSRLLLPLAEVRRIFAEHTRPAFQTAEHKHV
jgi:hypothetical protein